MSLHNLARQVQSKGRNGDTMLVHMTPGEVQGLQALALKHGGSLTINPETGLPEANILKSILPIAAGIALGPVGLGMSSAMAGLTVGGVTALASGNLSKGLMAGLGAYGGAGISDALFASGAQALAPEAIAGGLGVQGAATGAGSQAAMLAAQNAGFGLEGIESIRNAATGATGFNPATVSAMPSTGASIQGGLSQLAKDPGGFFKQNMFPIGAAALSLAGSGDTTQPTIAPVSGGQIRPYTYTQTRNPEFGRVPGAAYFNQTFTPGTPYAAKSGGIVALAEGGKTPTPSKAELEQAAQIFNNPINRTVDPNSLAMANAPAMSGNAMVVQQPAGVQQMPAVQRLELAPATQAYGFDPYSTEGQINTMYKRSLGRGAEPAGLEYWNQAIQQGATPAEVANAIRQSPEAQQREALRRSVAEYNNILADRAVNEYITQAPLLPMLPGGGERANLADTKKLINEYYLSELGRQADPEGLDYWAKQKQATGQSLADIKKYIYDSPEAVARRDMQEKAALEANPAYQEYLTAPITAENFDAAAYLEAHPDVKAAGVDPWQHYQQYGRGEGRAVSKKPFQASTTGGATPGIGGYIFDQKTGKFTKVATPAADTSGAFMNDPNFQAYLQNQYNQYQQAQYGYGGGGKSGGLMPKDLKYASGGISHLGGYSDGGRLLKGPGDGVSDSIPAQIGERQPARLADGEFVVPARIVSELGNGSTDAGARKLYAMMDRIQKKRKKSIGKDRVAVDSKPEGALPA